MFCCEKGMADFCRVERRGGEQKGAEGQGGRRTRKKGGREGIDKAHCSVVFKDAFLRQAAVHLHKNSTDRARTNLVRSKVCTLNKTRAENKKKQRI